jgi:hypothetical protein
MSSIFINNSIQFASTSTSWISFLGTTRTKF